MVAIWSKFVVPPVFKMISITSASIVSNFMLLSQKCTILSCTVTQLLNVMEIGKVRDAVHQMAC